MSGTQEFVSLFEAVALPSAVEYLVPEIRIGTLWRVLETDVDLGFVIVGMLGAALITWVNVRGIKTAALFQKITVAMIAFSGVLLITGAFSFGSLENAEPLIAEPATGILAVLIMVPAILVGFDVIPQSADEINLPYKQIGKIIIFSLMTAVLFYALVSIGVAMALSGAEIKTAKMATADAATALWANAGGSGKWAGQLLVLGGLGGIVTSWNAFVVGGSRVMYALAESGQLPAIFMKLHPKYRTPWIGILVIGVLSMLSPLLGKAAMIWMVNASAFTAVLAFLFVAISFVVLRRKEPGMERPFKVSHPRLVGYGAIILSLGLLSVYLPWSPSALVWPYEWGMIVVWALLGLILWLWSRRQERKS